MKERARFERDLLRFGADLSRWPDDRRRRAEACLADDPAARRAQAELARAMVAYREATSTAGMADIDAAAIVALAGARRETPAADPVPGVLSLAALLSVGAVAGAAASVALFVLDARHPMMRLFEMSLTGGLT